MVYRYDYGSLIKTNPQANNNFKPLSEVKGTTDYTNFATSLLEAKGITAGTDAANNFISTAEADTYSGSPTQLSTFQNLAGLSESDTAVARGDKWGGSDDTMGKSWLENIVSGATDTSNITVEDLYQTGFGRASDQEGLDYWTSSGQSIQDIAKSFVASEEATYRTGYHEAYGRDADQAGLDYWMTSGGTEHHGASDTSADFSRILSHRGDQYEQKETTVRDRLSSELGLHSTDAQRNADASLDMDGDGVADIFTDASEADVYRMMKSGDLGTSEVADKVRMQTAASAMGDYGGGVDDVGATGIHRMLANQEMGSVDSSGKWQSDAGTLAKTSSDYLPTITKNYDEDGNLISTDESNVWSLLKAGTQNYGIEDINKPEIPDKPKDDDDETVITKEDTPVEYTPELTSDVEDTSTYGKSKEAFDNAAAGIDAPLQDMLIRNSQMMGVGGSAEGVRLKRSKKFKAGETALGTKQLGRQLQLKSLNI